MCQVDSFCCEGAWDAGCVNLIVEHCPEVAAGCNPTCSAGGPFGSDFCGGPGLGGCFCDAACQAFGDCCPNVCAQCPDLSICGGQHGCLGLCGGQSSAGCFCDPACGEFSDCCPDVCVSCDPEQYVICGSFNEGCFGYCGGFNPSGTCWCDDSCLAFGDCCFNACIHCASVKGCPRSGCAGVCGAQSPDGCFCDEACFGFSDCCPDICRACPRLGGCAAPCPADFNDDDVVDGQDLGQLLLRWGRCFDAGECPQDIAPERGDGLVDGRDLGELLLHWGECP